MDMADVLGGAIAVGVFGEGGGAGLAIGGGGGGVGGFNGCNKS